MTSSVSKRPDLDDYVAELAVAARLFLVAAALGREVIVEVAGTLGSGRRPGDGHLVYVAELDAIYRAQRPCSRRRLGHSDRARRARRSRRAPAGNKGSATFTISAETGVFAGLVILPVPFASRLSQVSSRHRPVPGDHRALVVVPTHVMNC